MNGSKAVAYRIALAVGFLRESEQDFTLERWRSCVDNAQLAVENCGKAVLALFGIVPKTHDPARQITAILRDQELPEGISKLLQAMLPDLLVLLVRLKLGSPVLFRQQRPGRHGKPFTLSKFRPALRTMTDKRDAQGNLLPDTQRLTKINQFLCQDLRKSPQGPEIEPIEIGFDKLSLRKSYV